MLKQKNIYPAYASKHKSNCEKQASHLTISNGEQQWHLAVKKLSALLRGITSKHYGDVYCLNCLNSFGTKKKLDFQKKVSENKYFCNVILSSKDTETLEFNQLQKFDQASFIIHADLECLIEKIDGCKNNPENSSATKVSKDIPSGFSMSTISSFRSTQNKHDIYRGKD